jgi:hypothetical protein
VITVSALSLTPVKAMHLGPVDSVSIGPDGAVGNRRFYLVDERGSMVNAKSVGALQTIVADLAGDRLGLAFPDGTVVDGEISYDGTIETSFFSLSREARLIAGPWSEAISSFAGRPLRLVEPTGDGAGVDRGRIGAVTLISRASLQRLAAEAGKPGVDARRFRMLIEVEGIGAHEEDAWVGRRAKIGEATLAWGGHVGRCLITSRDPDTGDIDLPTLDILRDYRGEAEATEPLPFGIYGEVVSPGAVRVGDEVALL